MVNRHTPPIDRVFRALADPTRRAILFQIARTDCTVAELSAPFSISPPAVSRHLRVLEKAGILRRVRTGKHHRFQVNPQPLAEVRATLDELTRFWLQRLDQLDHFLAQETSTQKRSLP